MHVHMHPACRLQVWNFIVLTVFFGIGTGLSCTCCRHVAHNGPITREHRVWAGLHRLLFELELPMTMLVAVGPHVQSAALAVPKLATLACLRLMLQAPSCGTCSGRAAEPLRAQWEAAVWPVRPGRSGRF